MSTQWIAEARDFRPDPVSGAAITRLTSSPCINNNIYCEQPQSSVDGRRIAFVRIESYNGEAPCAFYVADLERLKIAMIEEALLPGTRPQTAAYTGWSYYCRRPGELLRIRLDTLEKEVVCSDLDLPAGAQLGSVSPDHRYGVFRVILPGPTVGILQVELRTGEQRMLFTDPEIVNPHLQYNPVHGRQILVQHNRGSRMALDGTITTFVSAQGTTLFVLDVDTAEATPLPSGPPHTSGVTGHEAFVADTGKVAYTVSWNHGDWSLDARFPRGNLFVATPGDTKPTVIETPEHRFNHLCISPCGRYFLCDSYPDPYLERIPLVVGNLETGKYATLVQDCGACGGGAQFTHPHAFFTTDLGHVIYNADPQGIPHVFKARIPEGFLAALD